MVTRWLLVIALLGCGPKPGSVPPSAESPLRSQAVPDFARPSLDGAKIDTKALRGRVMVVKFFAEYCEPCKRTLPAAQRMHETYGERVLFVGVSEDEQESAARRVVAAYGLTFPVVLDRGNVLAGRFRVNEIPVTFIVDGAGVVQWVGGPGASEKDLEAAVAKYASASGG